MACGCERTSSGVSMWRGWDGYPVTVQYRWSSWWSREHARAPLQPHTWTPTAVAHTCSSSSSSNRCRNGQSGAFSSVAHWTHYELSHMLLLLLQINCRHNVNTIFVVQCKWLHWLWWGMILNDIQCYFLREYFCCVVDFLKGLHHQTVQHLPSGLGW